MSLSDFVFIGTQIFAAYIFFWLALFIIACGIIAIFVALAILAAGRL